MIVRFPAGGASAGAAGPPEDAAGGGLRVPRIDTDAAAVAADPRRAWRHDTADRKAAYARRHGVDTTALGSEQQLDEVLELVVAQPDFLPGRWLRCAATVADAVARIKVLGRFGTGFLVSPWLMMTNNHVLGTAAAAAAATVNFRYEEDDDEQMTGAVRLGLQPERCFLTSPVPELDCTLVAVAPTADGRAPGDAFGHVPAHGAVGKILVGQPVNIVQHPDGRPREIAVRNNLLLTVDDAVSLTYATDTKRGSSGAPVLNDDWELVALHHSSRLAAGEVVGNIGIRVSAIVAHVRAVTADPSALAAAGTEAADLLGEFLCAGGAQA